jgi:hypothetical protein
MNERTAPKRDSSEDLIKAYKEKLAQIIDKRPSGTRQRLADALGKHRSFVTQMTSSTYPTPVPAPHLPAIFAVCHFSAEEKRAFMVAYNAAHPGRSQPDKSAMGLRHLSLMVIDFGDQRKNKMFDDAIADFAHRMGALAVEDGE